MQFEVTFLAYVFNFPSTIEVQLKVECYLKTYYTRFLTNEQNASIMKSVTYSCKYTMIEVYIIKI